MLCINQSTSISLPLPGQSLNHSLTLLGFVSIQACFLLFHVCGVHIFSLTGCLIPKYMCSLTCYTGTNAGSIHNSLCSPAQSPYSSSCRGPVLQEAFPGSQALHCHSVSHFSVSVFTAPCTAS